ncbi:LptF/LptG family permease, partial [Vibrio cholerae]
QYSGEQWQLSDVTTTHFRNVGQGTQSSTEVVNVPTEQWDIALKPELLNTVVMVPEALPISGLWSYIHYLKEQGLNNGRYWLAFWVKVLQPVVTAA